MWVVFLEKWYHSILFIQCYLFVDGFLLVFPINESRIVASFEKVSLTTGGREVRNLPAWLNPLLGKEAEHSRDDSDVDIKKVHGLPESADRGPT